MEDLGKGLRFLLAVESNKGDVAVGGQRRHGQKKYSLAEKFP